MDNATEHLVGRVTHAHATAATAILQHISRNIGNAITGPTVLSAPLFKAGKPPTKYATATETSAAEVVEFKEVVVTARHTHKLCIKVSIPKPGQQNAAAAAAAASSPSSKASAPIPAQIGSTGVPAVAAAAVSMIAEVEDAEKSLKRAEAAPPAPAPKVDIKVDWTNALSSIVSVDPIFDTAPGADNENVPAAVFTVVFLCPNKDAKTKEELPPALAALRAESALNAKEEQQDGEKAPAAATGEKKKEDKKAAKAKQVDDLVAAMTKKRTAFEWAMLALRRASEMPVSGGEAQHLRNVFQKPGAPSLRCRAYLVPDLLGGAAQRDEWVSVYRGAIQNYWQERLESTVIAAPEVFQWCCWAQYGGPMKPTGKPTQDDNHDALPADSLCLVVLSTQRMYIINAKEANMLSPESGKISPTAARAVDVGTITAAEPASYTLQLDFAKKSFAYLHFLCAQHSADFVLELQRVFEMVKGPDAEFPIVN